MKRFFLLVLTFAVLGCLKNLYAQDKADSLTNLLDVQNDTARVKTLIELCWYYRNDQPEKAKQMGLTALEEAVGHHYKKGEAKAQQRLGIVNRLLEEYEESQTRLIEALRYYEAHDNWDELIRTYAALGNLQLDLGNNEEGLKYFELAYQICLEIDDQDLLPIMLGNLGRVYENIGNYFQAKTVYLHGISQLDTLKYELPHANLLFNLGSAYYNLNQIDSSEYYNIRARKKYEDLKDTLGVGNTYINQGLNDEESGLFRKAIFNYHLGLNFALKIGDKELQNEFSQNLMLCYGALNNVDSMYFYFEESIELQGDIIANKTNKSIQDISIKYEVEKKDNQLNKADLANNKKRIVILILIGVIMLTVGALLMLYSLNREKQKLARLEVASKNNKIENLLQEQELLTYSAQIEGQEKERKRVAQDLHDRIGGLLATINLQFENEQIDQKGVQNIRALLDESIQTVRSISHDLFDGKIEKLGLKDVLENLKQTVLSSGKISFDLYLQGYPSKVEALKERELFKIVLELLSNTLKHADAKTIVLQINRIDKMLHLSFEDNGQGFDPATVRNGLGMRNISERVDRMGGSWHVDSKVGFGATTIIEIPLS